MNFEPNLHCADGVSLCAATSQSVEISLHAPQDELVSLSLQGNYGDAALTASSVPLVNGEGSVTLETSSMAGGFTLVAREGGTASAPAATLVVSVGRSGSATLQVVPNYNGTRDATTRLACPITGKTCADLASSPPGDGVQWFPASAPSPIVLSVPAGEVVAVYVRLGHYSYGCADVQALVAQTIRDVNVDVHDLPMALGLTNLGATFTVTANAATTSGWQTITQPIAARIETAFFPTGTDAGAEPESKALLDAMRALVPATSQMQFDQLRTQGGWDSSTANWLAARPKSIHDRAAAWLDATTLLPPASIVGHIGPEKNGTSAPFTIASFGTLAATDAGLTAQPPPLTMTADADDTLHISGAFGLLPGAYLVKAVDATASAEGDAGTSDVPTTLGAGIDCTGLADTLVGASVSYGACAAGCTAMLCESALQASWSSAVAAGLAGDSAVQVSITSSAPAVVGDTAQPVSVTGPWRGTIYSSGAGTDAGAAASVAIGGSWVGK